MVFRTLRLLTAALTALFLTYPLAAQDTPQTQRSPESKQKADAYYHFALGHLYAELARTYRSQEDFTRAVENYRKAIEADPEADLLVEELTELFLQANRWRDAVEENENLLKVNPDNLQARRILGRIYSRLITSSTNPQQQEEYVRKAMDHFRYLTEKRPEDIESWVRLGWLYRLSSNTLEAEKAFAKVLAIAPDNENALGELARLYADLKETKKAIETLERISDPNLNTLMLLANLYEEQRDFKKAAQIYGRAISQAPDPSQILFEMARALTLGGDLNGARQVYERLLAENPDSSQLYLRLSQLNVQERNLADARRLFDKAKDLDKDNIEVRLHEVELLAAESKLKESAEKLEELLESTKQESPNEQQRSLRAQLLERLAILYRMGDQPDKAVATFRRLAELDQNLAPRAAGQTIETLRMDRRVDEALRAADEAIQKFPDNRMLATLRANLLADSGKAAEGAASLEKMLGGEGDREIYLSLAQVYEKGKQYGKMTEVLEKAWSLSQTNEEKEAVLFLRGVLHEKQKDYNRSEQAFQQLLSLNPENASALNYLGYTLADRNVRLEEARRYIEKALELEPNNGAYLDSMGWVLYRLGKFEQAEQNLLRALEDTQGDPVIHDHLGDVYMGMGRVRDAIAQWEASLREYDNTPQPERDAEQHAKVQQKLEKARVRLAQENSGSRQP